MNRRTWAVQDAKARFSELLEACASDGPQVVTKRGEEAAVLVSASEWHRLRHAARPSLKSLLLADLPAVPLPVPKRGRARRRKPPAL